MSDIFREVDEALQQEKIEKLWAEYKTTIMAAIAILVLGTALTTAYRSWDAGRDAKETAKLLSAMQADNPEVALQEAIKNTRSGHEALGALSKAGLLIEENKKEDAVTIYKQIAENRSAPKDLRNLSRILYSQNTEENSIDILKPLLADEKSPWIWHARLQAAVTVAHTSNDYDQAIAYLKPFDEVTTIPLSLKQRAQALQHIYELKKAQAGTAE
jgi:hypothetical protein